MGLTRRLQRAEQRTRPAQQTADPDGLDPRLVDEILAVARVYVRGRYMLQDRIHLGEFAAEVRAEAGSGPEGLDVFVATRVKLGYRVEGEYLIRRSANPPAPAAEAADAPAPQVPRRSKRRGKD